MDLLEVKTFVETETIRFDGKRVIIRQEVSPTHATSYALAIADELFGSLAATLTASWAKGESPWHLNDFGERVNIRIVRYGPLAQVREGMFIF